MKLFVDDIRTPPDETWNICRTVGSAINALYRFEVEEIALDHDISHLITVDGFPRPYPCNETFKPVAIYIATLKKANPDWNPHVSIHTSNHSGAHEMKAILLDAGIEPEVVISKAANRLETIL